MNPTEDADAAAERARLERIAWGAASTPADAADARSALAARSGADLHNADPHSADRAPAADAHGTRTADRAPAADAHGTRAADRGTDADDRGRGLLAGVRRRAARIRRSDHRVLWTLGAAAVVIGFVAGTGVGLSLGARPVDPTNTVTPPAGAVTIDRRFEQPQTVADRTPAGIATPMERSSTRLVFTNRSLSGDDAATPWNVWAGVGRDGSTICLVASADQLEGTSACWPRGAALHGRVSLSATALSGTLTVRLVGGGVRASVTTGAEPMYTAGPVG
ncbi:hypothetical protein [Curtobacterium poinsettiae]|uniref:hypothetical protein n=1 Tax=Curtobacterium poinsettiae TaxID=159612 RepID=UPI00217F1417|nr:hypothetical protein [Curtobacterium flaccumfaciens]MCS6565167.1 hypothetical protein [Curtobacterium flaccumfaciens pv. flaccumfaciens]MCU0154344.1 hypothetical protein [Curtobacterium flaccumfaciens pv. poinsettiae]UXN13764.1 hypothetical protein N8D76_09905 [Curtobacterium flaccumfaciens pv. poinsettiae]